MSRTEERVMSATDEGNDGATHEAPANRIEALAGEQFCYLTTIGRVSGRPHQIEIWFATNAKPNARHDAGRVYLLSEPGEHADWVKNLRKEPSVPLRIGSLTFDAQARVASWGHEDQLARQLIVAKYEGWHAGEPLSDWALTATPVVIEVTGIRRGVE
jgi:deazaflavin-dependent oxidoreductase (nitroreductase family)